MIFGRFFPEKILNQGFSRRKVYFCIMKSKLLLFLLAFALTACASKPQSNLAFHKTAIASSNYDSNLTAQLVTDGIVLDGQPAFLEVCTSEGPVERIVREKAFDGDMNSCHIITTAEGWIEWHFHGYKVVADKAEVFIQDGLNGDWGGPEHTAIVPVLAGEDGALRIELSFPHEGRWRVKNVDFYNHGERIENILPAEHFTSAWMSEGTEDEWIMVDLGAVRKVDSVRPQWICAPDSWDVSVSRDGEFWKAFSPGRPPVILSAPLSF